MAVRKKYNPLPRWQGVFEQWTQKFVNKNHWRVAYVWGSHEDVMQECGLVFARCLDRYRGKVDNHAWFMSLYKISIINEFNTMAVRDGRQGALIAYSVDEIRMDDDGESYGHNLVASDMGSTHWGGLLSHLSMIGGDLIEVMTCIAGMPNDALVALFSVPAPEQQANILKRFGRRSKQLEDEFMINCVRAFIQQRLRDKSTKSKTFAEILEDLQQLLA